ncbi:MAG: acyl carrier protein [Chloroflexota bacterium]
MSVNASVEDTVKQIVTRIVRKPQSEFKPDATFKDMQADSLDIVQILVAVEDTYGIELQDEELAKITDMKSFVNYIERMIAQKKS